MEKLNKQNAEAKIYEALKADRIYAEVCTDMELGETAVIAVNISWGDWKHEHLRADWIIREAFGVECIGTEVTEEDGSDCYSAIHRYII